jgi:hypothetical protein
MVHKMFQDVSNHDFLIRVPGTGPVAKLPRFAYL